MKLRFVLFLFLFLNFYSLVNSASYSSCATLATGYNTLSTNVSAGGHCFWFNSNTELDCQGHTITGPGGSFALLANINKDNISIKNCRITNFQLGSYIDRSTNIIFENITSYGNQYGLWGRDSSNLLLNNSYMVSNTYGAFFGQNSFTSKNFTILNSLFNNNGITVPNSGGLILLKVEGGTIINSTFNFNYDGLFLDRVTDFEVEDITAQNSIYGFIVSNSSNVNISNSLTSGSVNFPGLILQLYANNTIVKNFTSYGNQYGLALSQSSNNKFYNLNISNNLNLGVYTISNSNNNEFYDSYLQNNVNFDLGLDSLNLGTGMCNNIFSNITGTLGLPILYYNDSVNLANKNLSSLFLCGANNSVLNNISINLGGSGFQNNGFFSYYTNNLSLTNFFTNYTRFSFNLRNSSDVEINNFKGENGFAGVLLTSVKYSLFNNISFYDMTSNPFIFWNSENNSFSNFSSFSSIGTSLEIRNSNDNNFENILINDTKSYSGVYLLNSSFNEFNNLTSTFNFLNGLVLNNNSNFNNFTDLVNLNNNTQDGVLFGFSSNNFFNNSNFLGNNNSGIKSRNSSDNLFYNSNSSFNNLGGLFTDNSDDLIFYNNDFSNNLLGDGIYFNNSDNILIRESTFNYNAKNGIVLNYESKNISIYDSNFSYNYLVGLGSTFGSDFLLNNSFGFTNLIGVLMENSSFNNITNSELLGNVGGIYFRGNSNNSEVFNTSSYLNSLGDIYFVNQLLDFPENNLLYGNTFGDISNLKFSTNFTSNSNDFNSSNFGGEQIGNFWENFVCSSTVLRSGFNVCLDPSSFEIYSNLSIFDFAPLSQVSNIKKEVNVRNMSYVFPTFLNGTKFSKNNLTIKFGDGVTDISPCYVEVNNLIVPASYQNGFCQVSIYNISGPKSNIFFQGFSKNFVFEQRLVIYYPHPSDLSFLSFFSFTAILIVSFFVGVFLW